MKLCRSAIEAEGAEVVGYDLIKCNLAESSVADRTMEDLGIELRGMNLPYAQDHYGLTELRELIAEQSGDHVASDNIMVTAGASAGLFIMAVSLLEKGDHVVVTRPNYTTNIETPEALGCEMSYVDMRYEDGFKIDIDWLDSVVTPKTKYVSLTCPNNPDGSMVTFDELMQIIEIVEKNKTHLLVDETYREMCHDTQLPVAATLSDRVVSISSMSKSYGVPAIRIGWMQTQDKELLETFLCAKEQIGIHGSILDETAALLTLQQRDNLLRESLPSLREGKQMVSDWIAAEQHVDWVAPKGGATGFVRIDPALKIDYDNFYKKLLQNYGTYPGPGHWFGFPKNYMRVGFAWNDMGILKEGLTAISNNIRDFI